MMMMMTTTTTMVMMMMMKTRYEFKQPRWHVAGAGRQERAGRRALPHTNHQRQCPFPTYAHSQPASRTKEGRRKPGACLLACLSTACSLGMHHAPLSTHVNSALFHVCVYVGRGEACVLVEQVSADSMQWSHASACLLPGPDDALAVNRAIHDERKAKACLRMWSPFCPLTMVAKHMYIRL